jgi:hypothetical protein
MDNLICTECGTTYYSAAARAMVARGERCDCGSLLRINEPSEVPVAVPVEPQAATVLRPAPFGRRRFTRG